MDIPEIPMKTSCMVRTDAFLLCDYKSLSSGAYFCLLFFITIEVLEFESIENL